MSSNNNTQSARVNAGFKMRNNSVNSILQSYSNLQEAEAEELDIDKK